MKKPGDIDARQASINGKPPRIEPLPQAALPAEIWEQRNRLLAGLGLPPSRDPIPEFHAILMRSPELMRARLALSNFLFRGTLRVRDRELAILRTGWLCQAPYEWGEHVKIGKRSARLTTAEILRIQEGSAASGWSDHERAILRAVEELISDAMITDETWGVLARTLSEPQLLELPILVGQYLGVAYLQNSLRVRLGGGNPGLTAR